MWLYGDRRYGTVVQAPVTVARPTMNVRFDSPIDFRPRFGGYVRVGIDGVEELRWPCREAVAKQIEPNGVLRPEGLSLLTTTAPGYNFTLRVPDPATIVGAVLAERGWSWAPSDKGRYAQALMNATGDGIRALVSPEALRLVEALSSLSRVKAEQLLGRRANGAVTDHVIRLASDVLLARTARWRRLSEVAGEIGVRKRRLLPTADSLLAAGLLRRGFAFTCPTCSLPSTVPLDRAADIVRCEGCRSNHVLAGPHGQEPELVYALNSLLDRAMDQDCIPHVLAALWVATHRQAVWAVPGATVTHRDGREREIDLLALARDALIVGELKASREVFRRPIIHGAARLARELAADVLLLGALDDWPEAERAAAESTASPRGPGHDTRSRRPARNSLAPAGFSRRSFSGFGVGQSKSVQAHEGRAPDCHRDRSSE